MLSVDTEDFEKSVDEYSKLLTNALVSSVKSVMVGTANALVENTPVGDVNKYYELYYERWLNEEWDMTAGMLMANWWVELNSDNAGFDSDARDTDGSEVKKRMQDAMNEFKLGDYILVDNETPYAENIEGGQSKEKHPRGMKEPTVEALMNIYKIQFKDFLYG